MQALSFVLQMGSYDECKGQPVYTFKIIMLRLGVSGAYRTYFNQRNVTSSKYMVHIRATMEQARETQLA